MQSLSSSHFGYYRQLLEWTHVTLQAHYELQLQEIRSKLEAFKQIDWDQARQSILEEVQSHPEDFESTDKIASFFLISLENLLTE